MNKLVVISLIVLTSIFSCKSKKESSSKSSIKSEVTKSESSVSVADTTYSENWPDESKEQQNRILKGVSDSLFFKIERTSCFGRCPTYDISVFKSGYVIYHGKRNVDLIGFFESRVSQNDMDSILKKANQINFFKLNDRYDGNMTDVPSTIMLIQYDDNIKVVVDRVKGPQELKQFEMEMDNLLLKLDYKELQTY